MKTIMLAACAVVLMATSAFAQDRPAERVAATVLAGFQARDATVIRDHSTLLNARVIQDIINTEAGAASLFSPARAQAAVAWNGEILPARYERFIAYVPFAIDTPDGPMPLSSGASGPYLAIWLSRDAPNDPTWRYARIVRLLQETYLNRAADPF